MELGTARAELKRIWEERSYGVSLKARMAVGTVGGDHASHLAHAITTAPQKDSIKLLRDPSTGNVIGPKQIHAFAHKHFPIMFRADACVHDSEREEAVRALEPSHPAFPTLQPALPSVLIASLSRSLRHCTSPSPSPALAFAPANKFILMLSTPCRCEDVRSPV